MNEKIPKAGKSKPDRNPLYLKIGKRIRQARLMAKQTNSRELSIRLGWSGGRMHNYECGISTPGIDETLMFCEAVGVDPCWITYGTGSPRATGFHSTRYQNFVDALDIAEREGKLLEYQEAIKLPLQRMQKIRNNPHAKIPEVMARRCEKYFKHRRGWIDEPHISNEQHVSLPEDMRELLSVYARLTQGDKKKFYAMGELLLG
jgi:transcriptional regulator with XRE-family HTH domain